MNPDITRSSFDPRKRFSRVVQQQGRVQMDADWNEQVDILEYRERLTNVDVIGPDGAPADEPDSFKVVLADGALHLGKGRFYTGGVLCQAEEDSTLDLQADDGTHTAWLQVWSQGINAFQDPEIRDPALGGLDTSTRTRVVWQVVLEKKPDPTGLLTAETGPVNPNRVSTLIDPASGYTGLQNFLYRIEIQTPGTPGTATFKWSRYNGSLTYPILKADGKVLTLGTLGRDAATGLKPGDQVQVRDSRSLLHQQATPLYQVIDVDAAALQITLSAEVTVDLGLTPLLQRWDQAGAELQDGAVPIPAGGAPVEIESGIRVRFSDGVYRTDDFWMIPARANYGLLWPQQGGGPAALPPMGIVYRYAELARLTRAGGAWTQVEDRRRTFPSLAEFKKHLTAANVSYQSSLPIYKDVANVAQALDVLGKTAFLTPMAITIGSTGQYKTLKEGWEALQTTAATSATFFFQAGEQHSVADALTLRPWVSGSPCSLALAGLDQTSTLILDKALTVQDLASFQVSGLRLLIPRLGTAGLSVGGCNRVAFDGCYLFGNRKSGTGALVAIAAAYEVSCTGTEVATWFSTVGSDAQTLFEAAFAGYTAIKDALVSLFKNPDLADPQSGFDPQALKIAGDIAALGTEKLAGIATAIRNDLPARTQDMSDILLESFAVLAQALAQPKLAGGQVVAWPIASCLEGIFAAVQQSKPIAAFSIADPAQSIVFEGNRILGLVVLGGTLAADVFDPNGGWQTKLKDLANLDDLAAWIANATTPALGWPQGTARFTDNEIAGLTLGDPMFSAVVAIAKTPAGGSITSLTGVVRDLILSGNRFAGMGDFLLAGSIHLSGNELFSAMARQKKPEKYALKTTGYAAASYLSALGNRSNNTGPDFWVLYLGVPAAGKAGAANLNVPTVPAL